MGIQKPDLSKFKKPSNGQSKKASQDSEGNFFMEMGKSMIPMIPSWIKNLVGFAFLFLVWGFVHFNYFMITNLGWGYYLLITTVLVLAQYNSSFQLISKLKKILNKK